jgi:hypothetical protein
MLILIIKWIILSIGLTACLAGGIALAGVALGLAINYAWRQMEATHSLLKLRRIVDEHNCNVQKDLKRGSHHE